MKRILLSLLTVGVVGGLSFGATQAFFSDTETSTNNSFNADEVNLQVGLSNLSSPNAATGFVVDDLEGQALMSFADVKPQDEGTGRLVIKTTPTSSTYYACMRGESTLDSENTAIEPEEENPVSADATGELDKYLTVAFWNDVDNNGVYNSGPDGSPTTSTYPASTLLSGNWLALKDSVGGVLSSSPSSLVAGTEYSVGFKYCFGSMDAILNCTAPADSNDAMSDQLKATLEFYAVQSANNTSFTCESMNPPTVGAKLSDYSAPQCTVTVNGTGADLQNAVTAATSGATVCVGAGNYSAVEVTKPLTLASVATPSTNAVVAGVRIGSNGVNVKGFKLTPSYFPTTHAAVYMDLSVDNIDVSYNVIDGLGYTLGASRGIETLYNGTYNNVKFHNNEIKNLTTGIYTNPHAGTPFVIEYNDINNNEAGIGGFTNATVQYNEFDHTTLGSEAIGADSSYNGTAVKYNNFLNGTKVNTYVGALVAPIPTPVVAKNNHWNLGGASQTGGSVDFTPEVTTVFTHR